MIPKSKFDSEKARMPMTDFDEDDVKFMEENSLDKTQVDTILKDSISNENQLKMIDDIFEGLEDYMRIRGLRLTDLFGILDKERNGYLRACAENDPDTPPPVFFRMQEMDSSLVFDELQVETWVLFMERGHRHEVNMGEDKAKKKIDVRITFNEFSKCFKQYLRKRRGKKKRSPRRVMNYQSQSSQKMSRDYVSRKKDAVVPGASPQVLARRTVKKIARTKTERLRRVNASDFRRKAELNLKKSLEAEKMKKGKLARKLATMTLEAVEAETDLATMFDVPTANLVREIPDQHWMEHEAEVEEEFKSLKHRLHHFGRHTTSGGTGGGLYFGAYTRSDVDQQLREEEYDTPHKRFVHKRRKSAQYYKDKYDISARMLASETEELEHTRAAIADCDREIESGKKELEFKKIALKNCEYKVESLLWMLKEIGERWKTGEKDETDVTIGGETSKDSIADIEDKTNDAKVDDEVIEAALNGISSVLPKWSVAFCGDGPEKQARLGPEEAEEMMSKMQSLLDDWRNETPDVEGLDVK